MSGGGSIGKVFSKVVKTVVKVAPVVLAAAAVVFTAGAGLAAMGALSSTSLLGGGLGAAMTSMVGAMGATAGSTLASVMAGALTSAAYGSVLGGAMAGIGGGNVMKGMQMGAVTGAVTGGVTAGLGGPIDAIGDGIKSLGTDAGTGLSVGPANVTGLDPSYAANPGSAGVQGVTTEALGAAPDLTGGAGADFVGGAAGDMLQPAANGAPDGVASATGAPGGHNVGGPVAPVSDYAEALRDYNIQTATNTLNEIAGKGPANTGLLSFMEKHPQMTGQAVGGAFQGAGNYFGAADSAESKTKSAEMEAQGNLDLLAARKAAVEANYNNVGSGGLLTQGGMTYMQGQDGTRPTPAQRFDPRAYAGQWQYDPTKGRVVYVPAAGTA